ncbi:MAG TPA: hypothetical protein VMI92_02835 [Steroidobacteraceae bacterium]|nr:hypothetical protein [Steroidobacteraceae bacterium]
MKHLPLVPFTIALAAAATRLHASEQIFPETYLSETLPRGGLEAEEQLTYREGKSNGTYNLLLTRTELEFGVTDRWLTALYVNTYSVNAHNDNSNASRVDYSSSGGDGDEITGGGPGTFGAYVPNASTFPIPAAHYSKTDFDSASFETLYNFLSPYADGVGLTGYFEYTYGNHSQEVEFKGLLQKNLRDDAVILAANLAVELERNSYSLTSTDKETEVELTGGASLRISRHLRAGFDARNVQGFTGYSLATGNHAYSAWFAGPMISGSFGKFFAVLGYQRQLPWATGFNHANQVEQVGGLNYFEFEKNFARLKFGLTLH